MDVEHVLSEAARALREGGELIVTVPFIYNEHDLQHDYRRFTRQGVRELLSPRFVIADLTLQGGVGSSLSILFLNWVESAMSALLPRLVMFMARLPAWLILCAVVNATGWLLDSLDRTGLYYGNVMARAVKPS